MNPVFVIVCAFFSPVFLSAMSLERQVLLNELSQERRAQVNSFAQAEVEAAMGSLSVRSCAERTAFLRYLAARSPAGQENKEQQEQQSEQSEVREQLEHDYVSALFCELGAQKRNSVRNAKCQMYSTGLGGIFSLAFGSFVVWVVARGGCIRPPWDCL
jgi:hypothetical protein